MRSPRLSVIVPAYNEAGVIRACLERLTDEIESIHEVLVVDNNSTDLTRSIVDEFVSANDKFSVINEQQQGLIYARDAGLNSATGDILARIDADTRVGSGWAAAVVEFFTAHGEDFAGGTGLCSFYDAPFQEKYRLRHREVTERMRTESSEPMEYDRMFGSNMVITAAAWRTIRDATSEREDVFEDLDIALCLNAVGAKTALIPGADATISGRRFLTGPISQFRYYLCDQRTYKLHGMREQRRSAIVKMFVVSLPFYFVMYVPFRAFDPVTQSYSVKGFFRRDRSTVRAHA